MHDATAICHLPLATCPCHYLPLYLYPHTHSKGRRKNICTLTWVGELAGSIKMKMKMKMTTDQCIDKNVEVLTFY
jgi:hypothetical protein